MTKKYRTATSKLRAAGIVFSLLAAALLPASAHALTGPYPASDVLGQPDFTSSGIGTTDSTLDRPWGSTAIDTVHHRLFVSDTYNNRVLVYNLDASNNLTSPSASNVIGEPDFTTNTSNNYASTGLNDPTGLAYDSANNRLFVSSDQEVNVYDLSNGISDGMAANYELGQPNGFGHYDCNTTQNNTCELEGGLAFDATHERLFATDTGNNRVLVFNVDPASIQTAENASYVIGQPDFTTSNSATSQSNFYENYYGGLVYIASTQTLLATDSYASRILSFDLSGGITSGMNASHVIGQTDFTSDSSGTTASTFDDPMGLGFDPGTSTLFVDDSNNHRVLLFDLASGMSDGMSAYAVLGQTDFTSSSDGTSQNKFYANYANQIAYDPVNNRIWLPDYSNSRVLSFDFVHLTTSSLAAAKAGTSYSQALATAGSEGTLAFSVTGGSLPPGLSLNTATGVISGTPTAGGSYTFEISVSDNNAAIGTFSQDPQYTITVAGQPTATVTPPATGYGTSTDSNRQALLLGLLSMGLTLGALGYRHRQRFTQK